MAILGIRRTSAPRLTERGRRRRQTFLVQRRSHTVTKPRDSLTAPAGRSILPPPMTQVLADEDRKPIRIGITVPEGHDAARHQRGRLDAFAEALAAVVGFEVTGKVFRNYREILDAMHAGAVEIA